MGKVETGYQFTAGAGHSPVKERNALLDRIYRINRIYRVNRKGYGLGNLGIQGFFNSSMDRFCSLLLASRFLLLIASRGDVSLAPVA